MSTIVASDPALTSTSAILDMPILTSPSHTLDTSAPAQATYKPIKVVGTLAIPALTYVQSFHSSTSLLDIVGLCLQNLDAQYKSFFVLNEEIELGIDTEYLCRKLLLYVVVVIAGSEGLVTHASPRDISMEQPHAMF